jgi:hypothetical protein
MAARGRNTRTNDRRFETQFGGIPARMALGALCTLMAALAACGEA